MIETWILVADNARARIFKTIKQGQALEQVQEWLHPSSRAHERDLTSDRPGRTFNSEGPGRHGMGEGASAKDHEAWKLCKQVSDDIEKARAQGQFDRLVLVAAPAFLGELRNMLSEPTMRLVAGALDKNLAQMDEQQIIEHLPASVLRQEGSTS